MKKLFTALMTIAFCMAIIAAAYAEDTVYYVQSVKAKVMSAPSFKSKTLAKLAKGAELTVTGKEGNWVKVKYKDKDGYVSSLVLGNRPPMNKVGVIKDNDDNINKGVRRRASSHSSAAAARGLAPDIK